MQNTFYKVVFMTGASRYSTLSDAINSITSIKNFSVYKLLSLLQINLDALFINIYIYLYIKVTLEQNQSRTILLFFIIYSSTLLQLIIYVIYTHMQYIYMQTIHIYIYINCYNYIIYLYELQKKVEKQDFSGLFSQQV